MTLTEKIKAAKRVYIIGNGGSYANAMHICNDLLSRCIKAYTMDPSTLTAFANDHGYDEAFMRWVMTVGEKGDLLIVLSGSGKSKNIWKAIEAAEYLHMDVHMIFGAPRLDMQAAEEEQLVIGHQVWRELGPG